MPTEAEVRRAVARFQAELNDPRVQEGISRVMAEPLPTHTLRARNLKVGHVYGVMPDPVSLVGTYELTGEDRATVEAAARAVVHRVLPLLPPEGVVIRWRPSAVSLDVYTPLVGGRRTRVATFDVKPVQR